jgi:hypothetical protein
LLAAGGWWLVTGYWLSLTDHSFINQRPATRNQQPEATNIKRLQTLGKKVKLVTVYWLLAIVDTS